MAADKTILIRYLFSLNLSFAGVLVTISKLAMPFNIAADKLFEFIFVVFYF